SHEAAVALVKPADLGPTTPSGETGGESSPHGSPTQTSPDADLQHANELVSLHYDLKVKYLEMGPDPELVQAERQVDQVISALNTS
ncbi:hypothetical protein A1O1_08333, partial [Capronia coronata CBS 617.96]